MFYALNLSEDSRILSITYDKYGAPNQPRVETLPEGDAYDYKYINSEYIYDPLPPEPIVPTDQDRLEAQIAYTAMMTDTLLPED